MKTIKNLNEKLVSKKSGFNYSYEINNTKFEINEYNGNKGWALNLFQKGAANSKFNNEWLLVSSYGYNGLTLKECKEMILMDWNNNNIK
jgi:hypothetical protein